MELDKLINTPMSSTAAILTELILWIAVLMFASDGGIVEVLITLILIELRHFRHIYHINCKRED